ncbi:C10 family peptidase [Tenacibaculum xiamenense]|uniref:C10 family peptidase n=1 Tax=Tenacibaculum xiamenense TaxID=1261553 RepID=UPI003893BE83
MKLKITFLTTLLFLCIQGILADPINKEKAILVANKWIKLQQRSSSKNIVRKVLSVDQVYHKTQTVYFVINYQNGGFVIVSANDATKPILAYSESAYFDNDMQNETTKDLLNAYKEFVVESANSQAQQRGASAHPGWNSLFTPKRNQRRTTVVPPFMDDILYTQSSGFQKYCPKNDDGQAIVGCVATAMAQVMRYWEFPTVGKGQRSYNHGTYGNLSVNFEEQIYDWDNMSKTYADDENAKLSYHCGVAVSMNYGTSANGGSGAYSADALSALKKYFKYNNGARMVYRYNYSDNNWSNLIKEQLNEKRPVLYSGRSKNLQDPNAGGAGHLFALDGYDTTDQGDYFHINWGWAGRSNGYFYLTEMITHGGKYNWIDNNAIMLDVYPTNVAPLFNSSPKSFIRTSENYEYIVNVIDENRQDIVELTLVETPSWLTLNKVNGKFVLTGTPDDNAKGSHNVRMVASDGTNTAEHQFTITVLGYDQVIKDNIIDFETADFSQASFSNAGQASFHIGNNSNHFAQTGSINDNQESILTLTENFSVESTIKFDYMVSSEGGYDFLIFKIDGKQQKRWSGEKPWATASFKVPAGQHTLSWIYKKDGSVSKGNDLAKIDNISYKIIGLDDIAPEAPTNLKASDVSDTTVSLNWIASNDNVKVKAYEIYSNNSKIATVNGTSFNVEKLAKNNTYTFFVKAMDYAGNISVNSNSIEVTTTGDSIDYCESKGKRVQYEWIDFVSYGGMTNASNADSGYGDFTAKTATIISNSTNDLTLSCNFNGGPYTEHFTVWIDYNQNGQFDDNEKVVSTSISKSDNLVFSIKTPVEAKLGETRMRVSLKYNNSSTPCEVFDDGEVEDYTVNIVQTALRAVENSDIPKTTNEFINVSIYPNPASHILNISSNHEILNANYIITDANGKVMKQNSFSKSINIEELPEGLYFIKITNNKEQHSATFVKSKQ